MTDRAKALVVHLDDDYRIGDGDTGSDLLIVAISMLKGVTRVEPLVSTAEDHLARERVRWEMRQRLLAVLDDRSSSGE